VIHVASPLPGAVSLSDDEMIIPATEGMKSILDACVKSNVKRLIVTSSLATIVGGVWKKDTGDFHYTEADVAPPDGADGYGRSKIA
jgi:dihydroflavonol-4-reductase